MNTKTLNCKISFFAIATLLSSFIFSSTALAQEFSPRHQIKVFRNGYTQIKLDYIDQAVDVEISRWATMNKTSDQVVAQLRKVSVNVVASTGTGGPETRYPSGNSLGNLVSANTNIPVSMMCNNNTDPTSKSLIHEFDHSLAYAFGLSYWQNVGPGHQAGGTWNGYNINGTVMQPFTPSPAYQAYCLDTAPPVCTANSTRACSVNGLAGIETCNSSGSAWGSCVATQMCIPSTTRSCSINGLAGVETCNSSGSAWGSCVATQICVVNSTRSCTINGFPGTETCNSSGSAWGSCIATQICAANTTQACTINGFAGTKTCNSSGTAWGSCVATQICTANSTQSCTINGSAGSQTCNSSGTAWGSCVALPPAQICTANSTQSCTINGSAGSQTCNSSGTAWGSCVALPPAQICTANSTRVCIINGAAGVETCNSSGTAWGSCVASTLPPPVCKPGQVRSCGDYFWSYRYQTQTCDANGQWGVCRISIIRPIYKYLPIEESTPEDTYYKSTTDFVK